MPNLKELLELILSALELIFGPQVPSWILRVIGYGVLIGLAFLAMWGFLLVISKIIKLWSQEFQPFFYDKEEKQRIKRRQRFADYVEGETRRLNRLEEWTDYRFAELEAEVEAEGRRRISQFSLFLRGSQSGLRRERSLSRALKNSQERLILLEGDPGSGKSVTLRYVAQIMARRAMKSRNGKTPIPIYINLKELDRKNIGPVSLSIDRDLIRTFVLKTLNRVNDRDIEQFLETEFDRGLREGTWFFLFDSFDEIPEILSSTEADAVIRTYAEAISDFLHGMNECRGVIASRQFRGPRHLGWSKFRILPLSDERRRTLIHKADLSSSQEREIIGQIGAGDEGIRLASNNPMFLGLLCEYVKSQQRFPDNTHSVLSSYIETRLVRDTTRLRHRFGFSPSEVRLTAERVAFCMVADSGAGLSPTRDRIRASMIRQGFELDNDFDQRLDALEYLKLARSETTTMPGESRSFTFAHRRFQEFFATCVVLREPNRVKPVQLLTDGRWRETTVVIFQTQPLETLQPLFGQIRYLLDEAKADVPELVEDPLKYVQEKDNSEIPSDVYRETPSVSVRFLWPSGLLHLLSLLQDGFGNRVDQIPDDIRMSVGRILLSVNNIGSLFNKKLGLEVAGIVPRPILLYLLRDAFTSSSQWLSEVAYRQAARLKDIPDDIARGIRRALLQLFASRRLRHEYLATYTYLTRLERCPDYLSVLRLLMAIPIIDFILHIIGFVIALIFYGYLVTLSSFQHVVLVALFLGSYLGLHRITRYLLYSGRRTGVGLLDMLLIQLKALFGLLVISLPRLSFSGFSHPVTIFPSPSALQPLTLPVFLNSLWVMSQVILIGFARGYVWYVLVLWSPFALLAGMTGQFTGVLWWPVMSLWPVTYLLANAKTVFLTLIKSWKMTIRQLLLMLITLMLLISLMWTRIGSIIFVYLFSSFIVIIALIDIAGITRLILDWFESRKLWVSWKSEQLSSIDIYEFLEFIGQGVQLSFRLKFVRYVRRHDILVADERAEKILEMLIDDVEQTTLIWKRRLKAENDNFLLFVKSIPRRFSWILKAREFYSFDHIEKDVEDEDRFYQAWLAECTKWHRLRLGWGDDFMDEVCKLLEHIRIRKPQYAVGKIMIKK